MLNKRANRRRRECITPSFMRNRLKLSDCMELAHFRRYQMRNAPTIEEFLDAEHDELIEAMEATEAEAAEMDQLLYDDFLLEQMMREDSIWDEFAADHDRDVEDLDPHRTVTSLVNGVPHCYLGHPECYDEHIADRLADESDWKERAFAPCLICEQTTRVPVEDVGEWEAALCEECANSLPGETS
jgi:hypothetical protein